MKSLIIALTFTLMSAITFGQNSTLVKVFVIKENLTYLETNVPVLNKAVHAVQIAYKSADNYSIGKEKGEIVKIVHTAPSLISNIYSSAKSTEGNPSAMAERYGTPVEQYNEMMRSEDKYVEIELMPEEIAALQRLVTKSNGIKYKLKETKYAIHESQKDMDSEKNVELLSELSSHLNEATEILIIGSQRLK